MIFKLWNMDFKITILFFIFVTNTKNYVESINGPLQMKYFENRNESFSTRFKALFDLFRDLSTRWLWTLRGASSEEDVSYVSGGGDVGVVAGMGVVGGGLGGGEGRAGRRSGGGEGDLVHHGLDVGGGAVDVIGAAAGEAADGGDRGSGNLEAAGGSQEATRGDDRGRLAEQARLWNRRSMEVNGGND